MGEEKEIIKDVIIEFEIENPELVSTNDQYVHPVRKTKNGRYMSFFARSDMLKNMQGYYKEILPKLIPGDFTEKLHSLVQEDKSYGLKLNIYLGIPLSYIRECDASNYIKALEDCLATYFKIDDSCNYKVSIEKQVYESDNGHWILKVQVTPFALRTYEPLRTPGELDSDSSIEEATAVQE